MHQNLIKPNCLQTTTYLCLHRLFRNKYTACLPFSVINTGLQLLFAWRWNIYKEINPYKKKEKANCCSLMFYVWNAVEKKCNWFFSPLFFVFSIHFLIEAAIAFVVTREVQLMLNRVFKIHLHFKITGSVMYNTC